MTDKALPSGASIAVIGAGIIGVASTYGLARRGYDVTVYDPVAPGDVGSSRANAGHVVASDIYSLSTPGIHWVAFLYDTQQSFISSKRVWAGKDAHGFDSEEMDTERIVRDIPCITDKFRYGVLSRKWSMIRNPLGVVRGLALTAESKGVIFHRLRVNSLAADVNAVTIETDKGKSHYDAAIVAAGVHSIAFAKFCGDFLPMVAERGYNLTIPTPAIELNLPLVFADRGIVATHLTSGLRIGGWAEYARPNRPANQNHFKSMARISAGLFPGLNLGDADFWMGNRPSVPDSVPVISRASQRDRFFTIAGMGTTG